MTINQETVTMFVSSVIGLATMVFGLSIDTAKELQSAVPVVVGSVMSVASLVSYYYNRRKGKEAVLDAFLREKELMGDENSARGPQKSVLDVAKELGLA